MKNVAEYNTLQCISGICLLKSCEALKNAKPPPLLLKEDVRNYRRYISGWQEEEEDKESEFKCR